eukprot:758801-Hanusia_phi.AAC.1
MGRRLRKACMRGSLELALRAGSVEPRDGTINVAGVRKHEEEWGARTSGAGEGREGDAQEYGVEEETDASLKEVESQGHN